MWKINAIIMLGAIWGFNMFLLWKAAAKQQ